MEWFVDPSVWLGLGTLIVLELVLGIDNLVFIAILTDRLPSSQRQKARLVGLSLALLIRLLLLASISWIMGLHRTLFTVFGMDFSGKDLLLILGGIFLIIKATVELHERLEGAPPDQRQGGTPSLFWHVIIQIVVLDAVFSLDSVITAVGMVNHLSVMMLAVTIAVGVMMLASHPLMDFVGKHPTVIILCLGFLLMIGFSLFIEGFGYHIPKEYLYAAIGFSVMIEAFNQIARRNTRRFSMNGNLRHRTAAAVLRLLGGETRNEEDLATLAAASSVHTPLFNAEERLMVQGVLRLGERSVQGAMTPRSLIHFIDLANEPTILMKSIRDSSHSVLVVIEKARIDAPIGILRKKDLADILIQHETPDIRSLVDYPPAIPETLTIAQTLEIFRNERSHHIFIIDEYGLFQGMLSLMDVIEAIAGDFPEEGEAEEDLIRKTDEGKLVVDGRVSIDELANALGIEMQSTSDAHTAAGWALEILHHIPQPEESFSFDGWRVKITKMEGNRIAQFHFVLEEIDKISPHRK